MDTEALVQQRPGEHGGGDGDADGHAKSALTRVEALVAFNGPRAMINFNDNTGGGDNVTGVALWNTCRESGDHG